MASNEHRTDDRQWPAIGRLPAEAVALPQAGMFGLGQGASPFRRAFLQAMAASPRGVRDLDKAEGWGEWKGSRNCRSMRSTA